MQDTSSVSGLVNRPATDQPDVGIAISGDGSGRSVAVAQVVQPRIQAFHDPVTSTFSYVVDAGPGTPAVIVDSVLDYDPKSGRIRTEHADEILAYVRAQALDVRWILETHAHADHLSAAPYLQQHTGGRIAMGSRIREVQRVFSGFFDFGPQFEADGADFDHLLEEGESLVFGALSLTALAVPGHTPACMAYAVGDAIFVGDTLFMPDVGTARCDFPGGDAHALYRSVQRLLAWPESTRLFMCHDYPPIERPPHYLSTVGEQRRHNIHVRDGVTEADFVAMRTARDRGLEKPVLILPSIQVNVRAGKLPEPSANGRRYLQIPLDVL